MKNTKKISSYQKEISTRQNIALLVESLNVLGKYRWTESPFQLKGEDGFQFDIARTLFLNIFEELQDVLIQKSFIISLENVTIKGISEDLRELDATNPILSKKIEDSYYKMMASFEYIQSKTGLKEIDLITLLLDSNQLKQVVELIVSENVPNDLKLNIFNTIITKHIKSFKSVFDSIPSSYYYYDDKNISYEEKFKQLLNKNLLEFLNDPAYIERTIRPMVRRSDEATKCIVKDIVEFFTENNLFDMNNITWMYGETEVTSSAAAYIVGNYYLGKYLYSLESYKKIDSKLKVDSDKAILETMLQRAYPIDLEVFIKNENYESTPEKLNHIMKILLKNEATKLDLINSGRLEKIISILVTKTKIEDQEAMQKSIAEFKENMNLSNVRTARQEFAKKLRIISDSLLEQYPATKTIKELQLAKTNKNTK